MPEWVGHKLSDETLAHKKSRTTIQPSSKIKGWSDKIKDASLFSARTTNKTYLDTIKEVLGKVARRELVPEMAKVELKAKLAQLGYKPSEGFPGEAAYHHGTVPPAIPGSMQDLSSNRRLDLIIDVNLKQARAMGQMALSEDEVRIKYYPAWRLRRADVRKKPRKDWPRRWKAAGDHVRWEGACRTEMVALKNSPIWQALGDGVGGFEDTLGSPFPPFAFGSGYGWRDVDRDEAMKLGLDVSQAKPVKLVANPSVETGDDGSPFHAEEDETNPFVERHVKEVFHPDMSKQGPCLAAVNAVLDDVREAIRACEDARKDAEAAANGASADLSGYPQDVVDKAYAPFRDIEDVLRAGMDTLRDAEAKVVGYAADANALGMPTDEASQASFDLGLERLQKAAEFFRGPVSSVAASVAKVPADIAKAKAGVADAILEWKKAECGKLVADAQAQVDAFADDEYEKMLDEAKAAMSIHAAEMKKLKKAA